MKTFTLTSEKLLIIVCVTAILAVVIYNILTVGFQPS